MKLILSAVLVLLASCEKGDPPMASGAPKSEPAAAAQGVPAKAPSSSRATAPPAAPAAPPASTSPDEAFRRAAMAVAKGLGSQIRAWGSSPLGENRAPYRVAGMLGLSPGSAHGYVIETAPDQLWLVSIEVGPDSDASAFLGNPFQGRLDPPPQGPPWEPIADTTLTIGHGNPDWAEEVEFALRGGAPVVFAYFSRDGQEGHRDTRKDLDLYVEKRTFAPGAVGVCKKACPPLKGFAAGEMKLRVYGPAPGAAALLQLAEGQP